MPQTFSRELCEKLSSLAPEMEGHWYYITRGLYENGAWIEKTWLECAHNEHLEMGPSEKDIPAWQVEDVLMNLTPIIGRGLDKEWKPGKDWGISDKFDVLEQAQERIVNAMVIANVVGTDTAYQKIEEYLWTVLK
jgi:hypothetical protein